MTTFWACQLGRPKTIKIPFLAISIFGASRGTRNIQLQAIMLGSDFGSGSRPVLVSVPVPVSDFVSMAGHGRPWPAMASHGGPWRAMVGPATGQSRPKSTPNRPSTPLVAPKGIIISTSSFVSRQTGKTPAGKTGTRFETSRHMVRNRVAPGPTQASMWPATGWHHVCNKSAHGL